MKKQTETSKPSTSLFESMIYIKDSEESGLLDHALHPALMTRDKIAPVLKQVLEAGDNQALINFLEITDKACQSENIAQSPDLLTSHDQATIENDQQLMAIQKSQQLLRQIESALAPSHPGEHLEHQLVHQILEKTGPYLAKVSSANTQQAAKTSHQPDIRSEDGFEQLLSEALAGPKMSNSFMDGMTAHIRATVNESRETHDTLDLTPTPIIRDTIADGYVFQTIDAEAISDHPNELRYHSTAAPSEFVSPVQLAYDQNSSVNFSTDEQLPEMSLAARFVTSRGFTAAAAMIALGAWLAVWITGASIVKNSYQLASATRVQSQIEHTLQGVSNYKVEATSGFSSAPDEKEPVNHGLEKNNQEMNKLFEDIDSLEAWPLEITLPVKSSIQDA